MAVVRVLTSDAHKRLSRVVRNVETDMRSPDDDTPRGTGHTGIIVEVTGPPVAMSTPSTTASATTTTVNPCSGDVCSWECGGVDGWINIATCSSPLCLCLPPETLCDGSHSPGEDDTPCTPVGGDPTTSTSSTDTTSTCLSLSTTASATTTSSGIRYVYNGKFVYFNVDPLSGEEEWHYGEDCWIKEVNNKALGFGCRYPGHLTGQYMGQIVIGVRNDLNNNTPCKGTTTTTSCICAGYCSWTFQADGTWMLDEEGDHCSQDCECVPPDFCPADTGCANTVTFCDSSTEGIPPVQCPTTSTSGTGTGTTSSTTTSTTATTTTTTHDPTDCGTGCLYKNVPGIGIVLVTSDCPGAILPDGSICGPCAPPPGTVDLCSTVTVPCLIFPPPPPPPGCGGSCLWVWPDIDGSWWLPLPGGGCFTGLIIPCFCDTPSLPGSFCNDRTSTPCHEPAPPTTTSNTGTTTSGTGTTSTTSTTTSTTLGGCLDFCQWRWDDHPDPPLWVVIRDCGSDCDCAPPLWDGDNPCDIARTPCRPTTTSSSTSSTTSTSTTTTCPSECTWECQQDSFNYIWALVDPCDGDCVCPPVPPTEICGPKEHLAGYQFIYSCVPPPTTTSTTSTTTTTTHVCVCPPQVQGHCILCCVELFPGTGLYGWVICSSACTQHCNTPSPAPPCDGPHVGDTVSGVCGTDGTTSVTATTRTGTNTTIEFTTAVIPPTTSTTSTTTTTTVFTPESLSPAAWFDPDYVYQDTAGTTPATAEGDPIQLAIFPGDNSISPVEIYGTATSDNPTLHIDGSSRTWFKAGTNLKLTLSASITQTLATDFYFATVIKRPTSTNCIPWSGSSNNVGELFSDNNCYYAPNGAGTFVSTAYTGATGDSLIVISNEAGSIYLQASGMAKTLMGTLSTGISNTITELLARSASPQWTDATAYIGPQVFLQRTPTSGEIAALCGVGGYFDTTRGVHL